MFKLLIISHIVYSVYKLGYLSCNLAKDFAMPSNPGFKDSADIFI